MRLSDAQGRELGYLVAAPYGLDIDPREKRKKAIYDALVDAGAATRTETRSPFRVHYSATTAGREFDAARRAKA